MSWRFEIMVGLDFQPRYVKVVRFGLEKANTESRLKSKMRSTLRIFALSDDYFRARRVEILFEARIFRLHQRKVRGLERGMWTDEDGVFAGPAT